MEMTSATVRTLSAPTRTMTSRGKSPATAAGESGATPRTTMPDAGALASASLSFCATSGVTCCSSNPTYEWSNRLPSASSAATRRACAMGTAKPMPSAWRAVAVLMPTTRPNSSHSGPPELPGFKATSVWMNRTREPQRGARAAPNDSDSDRRKLETMPRVTVLSSPMGCPMATTQSPTRSVASSPSAAAFRSAGGRSKATTARSVDSSSPSTVASRASPSARTTPTRTAPSTTCALVRTKARSAVRSKTKPEAREHSPRGSSPPAGHAGAARITSTRTTDGPTAAAASATKDVPR
mmetsp:Transcript_4572/g.16922  ORF Transcript_4572/g.16922 Transcript_4572/m.16922 type:complete len:296 (+) Transcript_4572:1891-2778(+)